MNSVNPTADFVIEIGTEELPPKALAALASTFHKNLCANLQKASLTFSNAKWFATPRRLTVLVNDLLTEQPSQSIQKLGPAVDRAFDSDGHPTPAATGFARSCGLEVSELQHIQTDKGIRLGIEKQQIGESATELLGDIVATSLKNLPIPKMMRWGDHTEEFVRPVKWVLALLDDAVVPMSLFSKQSQNSTRGHRFHCPEPFVISHAKNYEKELLEKGKVVVDFNQRKKQIKDQTEAIVRGSGSAIIDENLLNEVTALVEWPVAVMGSFDEDFLNVPEEALISSMQGHQKYFPVRDSHGKLANHFITISNIESKNPQSVISGNEKVIRPRLADARFFYDTDRKTSLADKIASLKTVLFQKQLGTLFDKSQRVKALAGKIAKNFNADKSQVERAAELAKCDLMSEMVGEFPHLQGIMGRYYALHDGESKQVAQALDEQYMPRFSGDHLPETAEGATLAVAERMDTLAGLFGIGQPPKGAKDPFALRRAALGVLRILMQKQIPLNLSVLVNNALENYSEDQLTNNNTASQLLDFLYQRFNAWYLEQGIDANVIHAVMAKRPEVVSDFDARVKAVAHFNSLENAEALAAANKRVSNILAKIPDQKFVFDKDKLVEPAEIQLAKNLQMLEEKLTPLFAERNYQQAMIILSEIRQPVDTFFDEVMVMDKDETLKNNRLALLQKLRSLFLEIADISLLY